MNLRSWMMLVFLLSAGTSLADVDVNWLAGIVKSITDLYETREGGRPKQYCLAANIPEKQDPNTLHNILPGTNDLQDVLKGNQVYKSSRIIIATPERKGKKVKEHAEPRVLSQLSTLSSNSEGNFLLIYSYLSPCSSKCADPQHEDNILKYLGNNALSPWNNNYAFVFTGVFDQSSHKPGKRVYTFPKAQLIRGLQNLGNSELGLRNIYRCFKPEETFQCFSCSSGQRVSDVCVNNDFKPGQEGNNDNVIGANSRGRGGNNRGGGGFSRGGGGVSRGRGGNNRGGGGFSRGGV